MRSLPPGWTVARVGDLIDLGPKNDCTDDTEVGFVPLQRLGVDYRSRHTFERKRWSDVKKGYTHFADGDVLLARITPSFENGKAGIVRNLPNGVGSGSTEYFVCRPLQGALLAEYLLAHFKTPKFLRDGKLVMSGAVGQQRVPKQYVLDSEILLAPLNEQKRIADKLDAVLERVDACRERLDRVPDILKRFRQAVLVAATSGKLTEDWRVEHRRSDDWPIVHLPDVGEIGRGKSKHRPRNDPLLYGGPYPFIQTGAVAQSGGRITEHTQTYSEIGLAQSKLWPAGTVCITIAANIADTAILEYPACFPDSVVGFVADPAKSLPEFVKWSIDVIRDRLEAFAPATAQKNINLAVLNNVEFQCPPLDEQAEIVRRVDSLFGYADRLEARYAAARAKVERLTSALLDKAFRGELVPQDPNDEPASVLLERIRAAREAAPTKPRRRQTALGHGKAKKPEVLMLKRKDVQDTHLANILKERGPLTAESLWSASQLDIDDFYDQLKDEEARGLLCENRGESSRAPRTLEAIA